MKIFLVNKAELLKGYIFNFFSKELSLFVCLLQT